MTLLVRDEADILAENLAFHLERGVDHIILMDNRSVDATAKIAGAYERAGTLTYLYQHDDDYAQSEWVTGMARMAHERFGADWVINADADEFWYPHAGDLATTLSTVDPSALCAHAQRTNFAASPPDGRPFWERMTVRYSESVNALGWPLSGKVAHRGATDVTVAQGNHAVSFGGVPADARDVAIDILHFPVRTYEQYRRKIVSGGAAYERNNRSETAIGDAWRHLYRRYQAGRFEDDYRREVLDERAIATGTGNGRLLHDLRLREALAR